jgi:hypothetical protein
VSLVRAISHCLLVFLDGDAVGRDIQPGPVTYSRGACPDRQGVGRTARLRAD